MSQNTINGLVKAQEADAISLGVASSKDSIASKKGDQVKSNKSAKISAKGPSAVKVNAASAHSNSLPSGNAKSKAKGDGEEKRSQNSHENSQNSVPVPEIQSVPEGVTPPNTHRKVTCVRYIRPIGGIRQQAEQPCVPVPPQASPQQICIIPQQPPCYPSCSPYTVNYCMTPYGCYPYPVSNPYPPVCPPPIICSIAPPPPAPICRERQDNGSGGVPQNTRPIIIKTDKPFYRRKSDDDYYVSCRERNSSDYYGKESKSRNSRNRPCYKSKSKYCRSRMSNDDGRDPSKTRSLMMKRYIKQSTTASEAAAPTIVTTKSVSEDSNTLVVTKIIHHYHNNSNSKSASGSLGSGQRSAKSVPGVAMKSNPSASALVKNNKPSEGKVTKPPSALSLPTKSKSVVNIPAKLPPESGKAKALKKRQEFDAKLTKSVHLVGETNAMSKPAGTVPVKSNLKK